MTRNVVRDSFIYPGVNSIQNNSFYFDFFKQGTRGLEFTY